MNMLGIALRSLRRDAGRNARTALIIAVGLAALLLGEGFMLSTYDALREIAMRGQGHVIITSAAPLPPGGVLARLTLGDWRTLRDELLEEEGVLRVLPRARFEGLVSRGETSAAFSGTGVDPAEEFKVHGPFLRTTAVLDPWPAPDAPPEVLLGDGLARLLGAEAGDGLVLQAPGEGMSPVHLKVRLAGLYHTGTPAVDDHTLMTGLDTAAALLGTDRVSRLSVYLQDPARAADFARRFQARHPGLRARTWAQLAELYPKVKAQYDRIFGVMGAIILALVFIAVANTIALATHQRRAEIATLAALGTQRWRIHARFVLEACLLGLLATALGMALAWALAHAVNAAGLMMPAPPGKSEGYPIYIYVSWPHYLATAALLTLLAALAAWRAVRRNARIDIAATLAGG